MSRYKPHGDVKYVTRDFFKWGPRVDGYDVCIEVRDVREVNGHIWTDGCHKVVVAGPAPRPRSKMFIGETAWCDAERYASDVYSQLQRGAN